MPVDIYLSKFNYKKVAAKYVELISYKVLTEKNVRGRIIL